MICMTLQQLISEVWHLNAKLVIEKILGLGKENIMKDTTGTNALEDATQLGDRFNPDTQGSNAGDSSANSKTEILEIVDAEDNNNDEVHSSTNIALRLFTTDKPRDFLKRTKIE